MTLPTTHAPVNDYLEEITSRLDKTELYQLFKKRCNPDYDIGGPAALALVTKAVLYSYTRHKLVLRNMGEFTLHDAEHLFRMLHLVGLIIPKSTLDVLSNPELMLLILSVFFHDIGMAPSEKTIMNWLGIKDPDQEPAFEDSLDQEKFLTFVAGRDTEKIKIDLLRSEAKYADADNLMRFLVSEYIRITHAERAIEIIKADWNGKFIYRETNLTPLLAALCRSHNEDGVKLLELENLTPVGQGVYICLPFLGAVLRLADILDFDSKRTPHVLYSQLFIKNPISIREWKKHRAVKNWTVLPHLISFTAECSHPAIQHSILQFCNMIDYELKTCSTILHNLHSNDVRPFPAYYQIPLPAKVDISHIKPELDLDGKFIYTYKESAFKLNNRQIIELLMGTKLYGQPNVALRELLQNSIDTCLLRQKLEKKWDNSGYKPKITIEFTKNTDGLMLQVTDNGCGMDQHIIDNFYSNIGSSYYKSAEFFELKSSFNTSYTPISRFGIGILSYFMITDHIQVETRRVYENFNYGDPLYISIEGQESIFYIKSGSRQAPGTTTTLALRKDNPWKRSSPTQIVDYIKRTIPYPPFDIEIKIHGQSITHSIVEPGQVSLEELKTDYNEDHPNLATYSLILDGSQGIAGKCDVILIEDHGVPKEFIDFLSDEIEVRGEQIRFKSQIRNSDNSIDLHYDRINTLDLGKEVKLETGYTILRQSRSKIALHGIELPVSLFGMWSGDTYQRAKIHWPICLHLDINIGQSLDINLNSARNEILTDDKWLQFEAILAELILTGLKKSTSTEYWQALDNVFNGSSKQKNKIFMNSLKKVLTVGTNI